MSLQAKIEAVIYASEEPVTLQQLVALLQDEALAELDRTAAEQGTLPLEAAAENDLAEQVSAEQSDEEALPSDPSLSDTGVSTVDVALDELAPDQQEPPENLPAEASDTLAQEAAGTGEVTDAGKRRVRERERAVRDHIRRAVDGLVRDYATGDRGIEIREVASGYRMATKAEYHDAVRGFVKSLKPALKLTLPALETLAVVAYKQPVTAAELSEIRGVDSSGVLGGLLARKLIATAGRKQVIGRPMLYKTTRDFLLRFGLKDVNELPSMDEFERMAGELVEQDDSPVNGDGVPVEQAAVLIEQANVRGDAEHIRAVTGSGIPEPVADAGEAVDADESDDALEAETAALASDRTATDHATAETAAGGTHDRDESAAAAPLHTAETGESAGEQAVDSAGRQAPTGAEEAERSGEA